MADRIQDALDGIHAEEALKARTKAVLAERINAGTADKRGVNPRLLIALACVMLVFLGGGYYMYFTPACAISVDVNPSVELGVNRFGRVVTVEGYNEDGARLAASVKLHNMVYTDALETLMASDAMAKYVSSNALISITVIGGTDEESEHMRSRIASCGYARNGNVECRCGNRELTKAAHEAGLSFGKYQAYLDLKALDPSVSAEDVQGLSMRQIRDWITQLAPGNSNRERRYGNGGQGNGGGYGSGGGRRKQYE